MKFKTFFQRRPASESDSMSGSTKRKKKESKTLSISGAATTKTTFYTTSVAEPAATDQQQQQQQPNNEKSSSACNATATKKNGVAEEQPQQPDEHSQNSLRFSCQTCGCSGRENQSVSAGADTIDGEVIKMKLPDDSPQKTDDMDLERAKSELEQYKELLAKANQRIQELTDEVEKVKEASAEKNKEFVQLHSDFLLCIRSAERFRFEAEAKADRMEREMLKLRSEMEVKEETKSESEICDISARSSRESSVETDSETLRMQSQLPTLSFSGLSPDPPVSMHSGTILTDTLEWSTIRDESVVKEVVVEPQSPADGSMNAESVERVLSMTVESPNRVRERKLIELRKNSRGSIRNGLLHWVQTQTQEYRNIEITNFSSSWANGLALAALIHSLNPKEFDYKSLNPYCPVDNFETALKAAEKLGVQAHLNAVKLLSENENPPWEPIVKYVTEVYVAAPCT